MFSVFKISIFLFFFHTVTEVRGKERVEAVWISEVDEEGGILSERREVECDTLLLSVGLIPENRAFSSGKNSSFSSDRRSLRRRRFFYRFRKRFFACANVASF